MNTPSDDELLLAVRYVSHDCQPAEALAFEERLAYDEFAQAALVEATQVVALLKATPCCPQVSLPHSSGRDRHRVPWSAVLAAGVVASAGVLGFLETVNRPAELTRSHVTPALALAWTALDGSSSESADLEEDLAESDELAGDVPDWLLTAVMVQEEEAGRKNSDSEEKL